MCNGTRLIFNSVISNKVLHCTIVESQAVVRIPRISFVLLSDDSWPIDWQRKQFPVKPPVAMTNYKSHGQTMQMAGLFLKVRSVYPWTTICSYVKSRITSKVKSCSYE